MLQSEVFQKAQSQIQQVENYVRHELRTQLIVRYQAYACPNTTVTIQVLMQRESQLIKVIYKHSDPLNDTHRRPSLDFYTYDDLRGEIHKTVNSWSRNEKLWVAKKTAVAYRDGGSSTDYATNIAAHSLSCLIHYAILLGQFEALAPTYDMAEDIAYPFASFLRAQYKNFDTSYRSLI